ncbi:MAG: hypothetical protein IKJ11_04710 [Clostridia bacterium]|nr:hypothetical protein [Clostridia bacterium]
MSAKKKKNWLSGAIGALIALACALVLAVVFYGAMAYQLADGTLRGGQSAARSGTAAALAIADAQLISGQTQRQETGGEACTVTTRMYKTSGGLEVEAVSADSASYITRLSDEGWTAQLVTGFTLAGMDAVYSVRGQEGMLSARDGNSIYMLHAQADEQTLYALGAGAYLE